METFFRDSKTSFEFAAFYVGVALFALRVTHFLFKEMSRVGRVSSHLIIISSHFFFAL